ncbi:MAG: hypothetical protein JST89_16595 [Cyanobacteria bacterium SZAS-4]|nr:hypothetical protein [Cyanobacteria bacterium SZAS-4]
MRTSALLFGTSIACLFATSVSAAAIINGSVAGKGTGISTASGASGSSFVVAPFTAGSTELFSSSIVNVSNGIVGTLPTLSGNNAGSAPQGGLGTKQGGLGFATIGVAFGKGSIADSSGNANSSSSAGFSTANNTSGTSSSGFSSANNTLGTSSAGSSNSNNAAATSSSGVRPLLVLTSLVNSTDPRIGSAGAVFQGIANTQISTVTFQFGSVAAAAGQSGASNSVSPLLAIDDQPNGSAVTTRYLPISSGTVSNARNGVGLTTVTFNANQLRTTGQVQRIGVVLSQRGTVAIDNITVNGAAANGILAQAQQSFPF